VLTEISLCVVLSVLKELRSATGRTRKPLALSTWAGPIECSGDNATAVAAATTVSWERSSGSVTVTRVLCGNAIRAGNGSGVCTAPAQPGMGLSGGDLRNFQLPPNASAAACAKACCSNPQCTGWSYLPSGPIENGVCTNHSRPCCWLKQQHSMHTSPSAVPGIVSGVVVGGGRSGGGARHLAHAVRVIERLAPDAVSRGVIVWNVSYSAANGISTPMFGSTSLDTWLTVGGTSLGTSSSRIWAPYGDRTPYSPGGYTEPFAVRNASWSYGVSGDTRTFGIPVAMVLGAPTATSSSQADTGISLSLSAGDVIVDLDLRTQQTLPTGTSLGFGRRRRRLGGGAAPVESTQYIIGHSASHRSDGGSHQRANLPTNVLWDTNTPPHTPDTTTHASNLARPFPPTNASLLMPDWRALLGWYVQRHSQYFVPDPRVSLDFAGGSAQYCDLRSQNYSAARYRQYGFTLNWDASFAWPWWGNFLPKSEKFERCTCVGHQDGGSEVALPFACFENGSRADGYDPSDPAAPCEALSHRQIASWYRQAQAKGVATLLCVRALRTPRVWMEMMR
jgi:hypothetical protein